MTRYIALLFTLVCLLMPMCIHAEEDTKPIGDFNLNEDGIFLAYNGGYYNCTQHCYAAEKACQKYAVTTRDWNNCWNEQQRCLVRCANQYPSGPGGGVEK